jgi:plasmid stability protein
MAARSESRVKTLTIGVRASPEEKEKLQVRAAAFGISMGELCRQAIFKSTPKSKTDQEAIGELAATRADLGRLGGLLKGWLSGSFPQGSPTPQTHADVVKLLHEIEDAQKKVVQAFQNLAGKS